MSIPYTITANGADAIIHSITFVDDPNIQHYADLSAFGGTVDNTDDTTVVTHSKTYSTGGYLSKLFVKDSSPITKTVAGYIGSTLIINSPGISGVYPAIGWVTNSSDNAFDGLHVVSFTSATYIELSGPPVGSVTIGGSITFSTTTNEIVMNNTAGIAAGWQVKDNSYLQGDHVHVLEVKGDNATLVVESLASGPAGGSPMIFYTTTNFLTLVESTADLDIDWTASGSGYNGQYITSIVDGSTVIMSGPPTTIPSGTIIFTSPDNLYTLIAGTSIVFTLTYTTPTLTLGTNYPSVVSINVTQNSISATKTINNFVTVSTVPVPPNLPTYDPGGSGAGGTGGGGGFTVDVQTFDDGSTLTTVTDLATGITTTTATDAPPDAPAVDNTNNTGSIDYGGGFDTGGFGGGDE